MIVYLERFAVALLHEQQMRQIGERRDLAWPSREHVTIAALGTTRLADRIELQTQVVEQARIPGRPRPGAWLHRRQAGRPGAGPGRGRAPLRSRVGAGRTGPSRGPSPLPRHPAGEARRRLRGLRPAPLDPVPSDADTWRSRARARGRPS